MLCSDGLWSGVSDEELEAYYRDIIPRGKLVRQISTGIYLPDDLLWQRWRDVLPTTGADVPYGTPAMAA